MWDTGMQGVPYGSPPTPQLPELLSVFLDFITGTVFDAVNLLVHRVSHTAMVRTPLCRESKFSRFILPCKCKDEDMKQIFKVALDWNRETFLSLWPHGSQLGVRMGSDN